jgi:hypothetical protein
LEIYYHLQQVTFDVHENGLKLCNSWAGHYILLNPDFKSQVSAVGQQQA